MKLTTSLILAVALLPAQKKVDDPFLRWMDKIAQAQLEAREDAIAEDPHRRRLPSGARKSSARKFWTVWAVCRITRARSMPGSPAVFRRTAMSSRRSSTRACPATMSPANLYRPNRPGRYPAVLLQAGHTQEGKAEPQCARRPTWR